MAKIPRAYIDELIQRCDIVELISARIKLKKTGTNYSACCPFHEEKTPSFTVSPNKQFYHCFGCGAHGNAISFLIEYDKLDFITVIEQLAEKVGMPALNRETKQQQWQPITEVLQSARNFYQAQLRSNSTARHYFATRGLSEQTIAAYKLGYVGSGWTNLFDQVQQHYPLATLLQTGLFIQKEQEQKKPYDRFRARVIFPIQNTKGQTIGFGGRTLDDSLPKYLNSPETPIFYKGRELYGLYEAKQAQRTLNQIIVVEGYMDVLALAEKGITNAVATLGTSTTQEHIQQLFRHTDEIIFCFDGDRAGRDAAWRALTHALPLMNDGRQARFFFLPENEDPDSWVKKVGQQQFAEQARQAATLSAFFFSHLMRDCDTQQIDGQARFWHHAKPLLETLPAGIFREKMLQKLAVQVQLSAETLTKQLNTSRAKPPLLSQSSNTTLNKKRSPIRLAITLLLQKPKIAQSVQDISALRNLTTKGVDLLVKLIEMAQQNPNLKTGGLLEHWRDQPEQQILAKLAATDCPIESDLGLSAEFIGSLRRIIEAEREQKIQQLLTKAHQAQLNQEEKIYLNQLIKQKQQEVAI